MLEGPRRGPASALATALALGAAAACARPLPPRATAVRAAAASPRFHLDPSSRAAIEGDLAQVNGSTTAPGAATLVFEEAAPAAGLMVERYRVPRGPTLLFAPDPSAAAVTVELHFAAETLSPEAARAVVELARPGTESRALARLERLGVVTRAGAAAGLAWVSFAGPTTSAAGDDLVGALVESAAELLAQPPPVTELRWSAAAARIRKHRTIDPKTMLERALTDRWPLASGRVASFDELDRSRAESARAALLSPTRAVLAVSGRVDRRHLLERVRAGFGARLELGVDAAREAGAELGSGGLTRTTTAGPEVQRATPTWWTGTVSVPGDSEVVLLAWPIPRPLALEDRLALEAVAHVLAGGDDSRLGRGLLTRDGQGVEARVQPRASGATFELFLALQPGRTATQAISLVDRELRALARGESTSAELEVARASLRAEALEELADVGARASRLARSWLREPELDLLDRRLATLAELREPALRAVAARWLGPRPRAEVVGRPRTSAAREAR